MWGCGGGEEDETGTGKKRGRRRQRKRRMEEEDEEEEVEEKEAWPNIRRGKQPQSLLLFKWKITDNKEQEVIRSLSQSAAASNSDVKNRKLGIFFYCLKNKIFFWILVDPL